MLPALGKTRMTRSSNEPTALYCSVLVLNKAYVPVHVVSARRSIVLLYRELAEVIHIEDGLYNNFDFETWLEYSEFLSESKNDLDDWIQGIQFELMVPRVIRLYRYNRVPKQTLRFNRKNLFARDQNRCQYCDLEFPTHQLSFDHVMPKSRGGDTSWSNVVCCCLKCNSTKGNRTPHEADMQLIRKPTQPYFSPVLSLKLADPKYHIWRSFIHTKHKEGIRL